MARKSKAAQKHELSWQAYREALRRLEMHPLFRFFMNEARIIPGDTCPKPGWALVTSNGDIHVNIEGPVDPEEWIYVLAHSIAHLGFGHFREREYPALWNAACDCFVARFLGFLQGWFV